MPMTGIPFKILGIPLPIWRTEDKQEEILVVQLKNYTTKSKKSIAAGFKKKNPFKGFEIGNMDEAIMI
jgi:isoleucyl-tRNA synthetase